MLVTAFLASSDSTDESFTLNAETLAQLAHDSRAFKAAIEEQIVGCRSGLKLIPLPPPLIRI
jgi:hypothetical protein